MSIVITFIGYLGQPLNLFSLGNSNIKMLADVDVKLDCSSKLLTAFGRIDFIVEDEYKDARDIHDRIPGNQEFPYGKSFNMFAYWDMPVRFSGEFY